MKTTITIVCILVVLSGIVLAVLSHPAFGVWRHVSKERIQASPNYRDGMFRNQELTPQFTGDTTSTRGTLWRFLTNKDTLRVPNEPIPAVKTDLKSLPTDSDWLVWFGHSSYLFSLNGKRYLVDPVLKPEWPATLMMKPFAGTDIYRPDDLPDIDVLIITHEHWDHMEYATLRDIRDRVKQVVCPLGIADYLRYWDYTDEQITEMDWYDQLPMTNDQLQITALPSRHFSNRLLGKRNQTLWASFMVEAGGRKVYIGMCVSGIALLVLGYLVGTAEYLSPEILGYFKVLHHVLGKAVGTAHRTAHNGRKDLCVEVSVIVYVSEYALECQLVSVIVGMELEYLIEECLIEVFILLKLLSDRVDIQLQLHKVKSPEVTNKSVQKPVYYLRLFEHCNNARRRCVGVIVFYSQHPPVPD